MGDPALSLTYRCIIDGFIPLGTWSKIEGLQFEYDVFEYREGGVNGFTHKIVGPAKYGSVRLSRPVDSTSMLVQAWLESVLFKMIPQTMAISACNAAGEVITTWSLVGVVPTKWSGPSLDVNGNQVAQETLEVVFQQLAGFGMLGEIFGGLSAGMSIQAGMSIG